MSRVLKLEELAPYLPYGLIIENSIGKQVELTVMDFGYHFDKGCKPILKPASDLLSCMGHIVPLINKHKEVLNEETNKDNMMIVIIKTLESSNKIRLKLLELHFDVFGLIDAGLAIDINTIK